MKLFQLLLLTVFCIIVLGSNMVADIGAGPEQIPNAFSPVSFSPEFSCSDSDEGQNYFFKGYVSMCPPPGYGAPCNLVAEDSCTEQASVNRVLL